jgi:hypothetical protein
MKSILKSKKGIETSPLFLIFSAVILVLTAAIVFPAMMEWERVMDKGKAIKETVKLRNAINEIHLMGDLGSVEQVHLNLPQPYEIEVKTGSVVLRNSGNNEVITEFDLDVTAETDDKISDNAHITLACWGSENRPASSGKYTIWVY